MKLSIYNALNIVAILNCKMKIDSVFIEIQPIIL